MFGRDWAGPLADTSSECRGCSGSSCGNSPEASTSDWSSTQGSVPAHAPASPTHNSPTAPPMREPPLRADRRAPRTGPKHKAARAHGQGPVSPRQEPHRERVPRGREPPRNRGASRPPPSVAAPRVDTPQQKHVRHRTLASQPPRGRRDSDRSIAKTRLELSIEILAPLCLRARSGGAKRCRSSYFWPRTSCAAQKASLRPPKSSRASRCLCCVRATNVRRTPRSHCD